MKTENFAKVLVLIGLVGLAGCGEQVKQTATPSGPGDTNTQPTVSSDSNGQQASDVKVYEATGDYVSPAGPETVDVKLSLDKNKKVTDVNFVNTSTNPRSRIYMNLFLEGIKKEIVGKNLSDVGQYTVVNGSSLTSEGFNKAISQIKSEAI